MKLCGMKNRRCNFLLLTILVLDFAYNNIYLISKYLQTRNKLEIFYNPNSVFKSVVQYLAEQSLAFPGEDILVDQKQHLPDCRIPILGPVSLQPDLRLDY